MRPYVKVYDQLQSLLLFPLCHQNTHNHLCVQYTLPYLAPLPLPSYHTIPYNGLNCKSLGKIYVMEKYVTHIWTQFFMEAARVGVPVFHAEKAWYSWVACRVAMIVDFTSFCANVKNFTGLYLSDKILHLKGE